MIDFSNVRELSIGGKSVKELWIDGGKVFPSQPSINYIPYLRTFKADANLDYIPTQNTKVEGGFNGDALGNWFVGTQGQAWRFFNAGDDAMYMDVPGGRINRAGYVIGIWYEMSAGNHFFNCVPDDPSYQTLTNSSSAKTFTLSTPLWFSSYNYSWSGQFEDFLCRGFKIYEGNVLTRDYRPAKDENGVVCFHEEVQQTWVYPTHGTFTES